MKALFFAITIIQAFAINSWADVCEISDEKLPNLKYEHLGEIQGNKVFVYIGKYEGWDSENPIGVAVKTILTDQKVKFQDMGCTDIVQITYDKVSIEDDTLIIKTTFHDRYDSSQSHTTEKFKLDTNNKYFSISSTHVDDYSEAKKSLNLSLKNKDLKTAVQARNYILSINRNGYNQYQSYNTNIDICFRTFDLGFNILSNLFDKSRKNEYTGTTSIILDSPNKSANCLSILDITEMTLASMNQIDHKEIRLDQSQIKKLNAYANLLIKTKQYDLALDFLKVIIGADLKNIEAYNSLNEIYKKTNLKTFALMSNHIHEKLNGKTKSFSSNELKSISKEMKINCLPDETLSATYTEFLSYPSVRVDCIKGKLSHMKFYWNPRKGKILDFKICPATGVASKIETMKWKQQLFSGLLNISSLKNCNKSSWYMQKTDCKWTIVCEDGLNAQIKSKLEDSPLFEHIGLLDVVDLDEINDTFTIVKQTSATKFDYGLTDKSLNIKEKIYFTSDIHDSAEIYTEIGNWKIDCSTNECNVSKYNCTLPNFDINGRGLSYNKKFIDSPSLYGILKYNNFDDEPRKGEIIDYFTGAEIYKIDVELMRANQKSCLIK